MAVKLTKDGEVDKRTKEYKDSQKKKFRWWKIPFYPFYWIYRLIKFILTLKQIEMAIRYRLDGGVDMRTTAGKLSGGGGGKRGCIWGLISGFFMFIFYFY